MLCGVVNHAECAPALPPLSCPCAPLGVQPLMAIDTGEMTLFYTRTLTLKPNTGQQEQPPAEPREKSWRWWIQTRQLIDTCPKSFRWITHNCWDFGCLLVYCNVGVWILQSETEFKRLETGLSLRVRFLPVSRMQRAGGTDRGWGQWAECVWVLSPCGVIVDRDGSRSGWGQRSGNTGSHDRTWGWQLFGLHRYCCCSFPMTVDNVSLHTFIHNSQEMSSWSEVNKRLVVISYITKAGYSWTFSNTSWIKEHVLSITPDIQTTSCNQKDDKMHPGKPIIYNF